MNASQIPPLSCTRRVIGLHAASVTLAAVLGVAAALVARHGGISESTLVVVAAVILLIVLSAWQLNRVMRQSAMIERLLANLAPGLPTPQELPQLLATSPAAMGWNRIARQAKIWFALDDLQQSLAAGLPETSTASSAGLVEALPEGIAATNLAGNLQSANPAFVAIFQIENPSEILGTAIQQACGLADAAMEQFHQGPQGSRVANEFATLGDRRIRLTRVPRFDPTGNSIGHAWIARDVTQQRLAEEMRDKALSTATHELRTPLANLCAYAETLATMDDLDVESQKEFYNTIQSESLRLSQLVDELLDVSRMQAGAMTIERAETDLSRLVGEVTGKIEGAARAKNIQILQELPPKLPKAMLDKSKLAASLVNLLGNAVKYTPEGGRVTFRVDLTDQQLEFAITDTGIGIAAEEISRVFDRFFRSDDQRVRDISGSGLGLALTQEVARLHGGDVTVDSELNVGSVFRMTLPLELC